MRHYFLAVLCLLAVFPAGCAKPEYSFDLYHHMTGNVKELLAEYQHRFRVKHPEIRINLMYKAWGEIEELMRRSGERNDLDFRGVYLIPHDRIGQLAENGHIRDNDAYLARQEVLFLTNVREAISYRGRRYGLPVSGECTTLLYNTNLVPSPPRSFEEMLALRSRFLVPAEGRYLLLLPLAVAYFVLPWAIAGGGTFFDGTGQVRLDGPGTPEAFNKLRNLLVGDFSMCFMEDMTITEKMVMGKLPFVISGPWFLSGLVRDKAPVAVAEMPTLDGKPFRTFFGVQCLVLSRHYSDDGAAAFGKFYDFLVESGFFVALSLESKAVSPLLRDHQDPRILADPLVAVFSRQAARGIPMDNTPAMAQVWDAFNSLTLKAILTGSQDSRRMLTALQREVERKPLLRQ